MTSKFFTYDPQDGFELHETEQMAVEYTQQAIDTYREAAACDGWDEDAGRVCWGELRQRAVAHDQPDCIVETDDGPQAAVDYTLDDVAPVTRWQPMASAPKDGTAILVLIPDSDIPKSVRWRNECWEMTWDGHQLSEYDTPRYWMPCPADPDKSIAQGVSHE